MPQTHHSRHAHWKEYPFLVFAGALYACALKYFVFPAGVILTGFEGISVALSYFFEAQWLFLVLYAIFQTSLLTFAALKVSRRFALRSAVVIGMVLLLLPVLPELRFANPEPHAERILLVLFGGILAGFAKSVAFRRRGSTGDEDVIAAYVAQKYLKPVGFIAILAGVVSTGFGMTLDVIKTGNFETAVNTLMYTAIYIFVSAETLNNFFHKFKLSLLTIITKSPDLTTGAIRRATSHRTWTIEKGRGGHSGAEFNVVRTVITYEELEDVVDAVEADDPSSFLFHHDVEGITNRYFFDPIG